MLGASAVAARVEAMPAFADATSGIEWHRFLF